MNKKQRLKVAKQEHLKFLKSHSIDGSKRPKLLGVDGDTNKMPVGSLRVACAGRSFGEVPGNGTKRDLDVELARGNESAETAKQIKALSNRIGPLYNKGPLQLITNLDDFKNNGRRDR